MADPLDASTDPNSQRILALIAARQAEQASALNAPPMAPVGSISMGTNPLAPVMAPPTPALVPGAATPTANLPPQVPAANTMAPAMPNLAAPAAPNVTEEKPQPGIAKRLLTNFLYGGGQALLHRVGLPTDYEQQQRNFDQSQAQLTQSRLQQGADDMTAYRTAQVGGLQSKANKLDTLNELVTIPNEPIFGRFAGQQVTRGAFEALAPILTRGQTTLATTEAKGDNAIEKAKIQFGPDSPRNLSVTSHDGKKFITNKVTGQERVIGTDTSMITGPRNAEARARESANYATVNSMDAEGNPIAITRLVQRETGAPTMTEKATQTLSGDKLGAATYLAANKIVRNNISVLRDPQQRAIIARATEEVERNPGAIDSIINSKIQEGLSPQGGQLISAMKQMNEFGSAFKKYTGNGGSSTDSLRATIHANQPSSANSEQVNLNLLSQDEKLAQGVLKNLARPSKYSVPAKNTPSAAAAPASNGGHPSFFHPIANQ